MTTSTYTIRDAQPKAVEEAGSLSYGITDAPNEPEDKGKEENLDDVPEDEVTGDESSEEDDELEAQLPGLPEIPTGDDLKFDFDSFFATSTSEVEEKVHKRASNVLKLTQENEKLQAKLKAMAEQLEAMERLRGQLATKEQHIVGKRSS